MFSSSAAASGISEFASTVKGLERMLGELVLTITNLSSILSLIKAPSFRF